MLNDLAVQIEPEKARDLLQRLEDKRVDQVLPAEVELGLIWALSRVGEVDIEPSWWGDEKRPDAYTEELLHGEPAIIEIAAPSDNMISGEEAMDSIALKVSNFANSLDEGLGDLLYYRFGTESGHEGNNYFRRRLAPAGYVLSAEAQSQIRAWIETGEVDRNRLRLVDAGLCVEVERKEYKQTRYHNIWSSMPPETHSLEDNPLYKLLIRKLRQLRASHPKIRRFIFLGDAGSTLLNHLGRVGEIDPTRHRVSGREIISHFVRKNRSAVDSVVVIAPTRDRGFMGRDELRWQTTVFNRPEFSFQLDGLKRLVDRLPLPRYEGYQARSLFRQGSFSPLGSASYLGMHITSVKGGPMKAKVSARALLDLLAGRMTPEQFRRACGERPGEGSLFKRWLDSGFTLQDVSIESGGVDEDDDHLVLTFGDDPAARRLRIPSVSASDDEQK